MLNYYKNNFHLFKFFICSLCLPVQILYLLSFFTCSNNQRGRRKKKSSIDFFLFNKRWNKYGLKVKKNGIKVCYIIDFFSLYTRDEYEILIRM